MSVAHHVSARCACKNILSSCHCSNAYQTVQGICQSVVVEPYQASAECTEFSVTVIGSSKGPVALLPTEAESFNMEDDIAEAGLEFEAYKARQEVCLLLETEGIRHAEVSLQPDIALAATVAGAVRADLGEPGRLD